MIVFRRAEAFVAALFILTASVAAKTVTATTGVVNGIVTDSTHPIVPGVTVRLSGPSLVTTQTALTDDTRAFRFSAVPTGNCAPVTLPRHQSGAPFPRTFVQTVNDGNATIKAGPIATNRTSDIALVDVWTDRFWPRPTTVTGPRVVRIGARLAW